MKHAISTFLLGLLFVLHGNRASAQNLIQNGTFDAMGAGWSTSCNTVEAWGFETTYGGPSPTNHVAEIDDDACMHQDICVLEGASYIYSMEASCRTAGGPNPCTSHINIIGLDGSGGTVMTFVDMDYVRTNAVFGLTPVTGIPGIVIPTGLGIVKVRLTLTDNTSGYSTLGMIIDNLSLTFSASPFVVSPDTACLNSPVFFNVAGVSGPSITYNWAFGPGAVPPFSTLPFAATQWNTPGLKTTSVILGNGVCFVDTLYRITYISPAIQHSIYDTTCFNIPFVFHGTPLHFSGVYRDTIVTTGGCDSIVTLNLYVKPPVVTQVFDTICAGSTFVFNGHPYVASGIYADTFLTSLGCDSVGLLHLLVNPKPPVPVVTGLTFCQFDAGGTLSATGTSLMWYGPGIPVAGTSLAPSINTYEPGFDTFYVTQTVSGCTSDKAKAVVIINPKPLPPKAVDVFYCQHQVAAPLTATGANIKWYSSPLGGSPLGAAPTPSTDIVSVVQYYASQTVNGCESDRKPVTSTVVPVPQFNLVPTHDHFCQGDTATFYYDGSWDVQGYLWQFPRDVAVAGHDIFNHVITLKFDDPGYKNIYLTVTSPNGTCSTTDTMKLNVVPTPEATSYTRNELCLGDTAYLALSTRSANADSFFWFVDGTPLHQSNSFSVISQTDNTAGPFTIVWSYPGTHTIEMFAETKEGCRSINTFDSIKVINLPNADFAVNTTNGKLCLSDSVSFQAELTGYGYAYQWSPAHYFNNLNSPTITGRMEESLSNVTLTVTDAFGCVGSVTKKLNPETCCTVLFPTAFTPNGDSYNNLFRPILQGYHNFHVFRIMNRWGQTVFESANNWVSWDGTYNGVPQDMGVYYYYIKYDCGGNTFTQTGDITLIR